MEDGFTIALVGGCIGGIPGVVGTIISAYHGPIKLEQWKERRRKEKRDGARKKLLLGMLEAPELEIRSIETLCRASGTTKEERRRLLIEIDAGGIRMRGNREGWAPIRNRPLEDASDLEQADV